MWDRHIGHNLLLQNRAIWYGFDNTLRSITSPRLRELFCIMSNIAYTSKEPNECLALSKIAYTIKEPNECLRIRASPYQQVPGLIKRSYSVHPGPMSKAPLADASASALATAR